MAHENLCLPGKGFWWNPATLIPFRLALETKGLVTHALGALPGKGCWPGGRRGLTREEGQGSRGEGPGKDAVHFAHLAMRRLLYKTPQESSPPSHYLYSDVN